MAISLTPAAADRIQKFIASRGHGLGLKLGVRKTGCSGFAYVVNYADQAAPEDVVFEDQGVKVFVDPESLQLIDGHHGGFRQAGPERGLPLPEPQYPGRVRLRRELQRLSLRNLGKIRLFFQSRSPLSWR